MKTLNKMKYQFKSWFYAEEDLAKAINHLGGADFLNQTLTSDQEVKYNKDGSIQWHHLWENRFHSYEKPSLNDYDCPTGYKVTVEVYGSYDNGSSHRDNRTGITTALQGVNGGSLLQTRMTKELTVEIPMEALSAGTEFKFRDGQNHGVDVYVELGNGDKVLPVEYALNVLAETDSDLDAILSSQADENGVIDTDTWRTDVDGISIETRFTTASGDYRMTRSYDCNKKCCWKDDHKNIKEELTILGDFS
jgi:hypothetical protein